MKIDVEIEHTTMEGDHGGEVEGLCATCSRCGHTVEVYGTDEPSSKRACVMLREECPQGERNFYVTEYEGH